MNGTGREGRATCQAEARQVIMSQSTSQCLSLKVSGIVED